MFDIEMERKGGYTQITCKGAADFASLKDVVDKIKAGAFGSDADGRYLIDLRQIMGSIGTIQRFELGKYMAQNVPTYKIAAISKKETYNKIGENVAVNRGAHVLATDDEVQAIAWLTSDNVP